MFDFLFALLMAAVPLFAFWRLWSFVQDGYIWKELPLIPIGNSTLHLATRKEQPILFWTLIGLGAVIPTAFAAFAAFLFVTAL